MFFHRRSRRFSAQPDEHYPGLSHRQAHQLRAELREKLAESGASIRFDGNRGIIDHPSHERITLNLQGLIDEIASSQHPRAVKLLTRSFIETMVEDQRVAGLDTAELYAGLRLRVAPLGGLVTEEADILNSATVRGFTSDTAVTMVLDTAHSIRTLPLERLRKIDDLETLVRAARNNLRAELNKANVRSHVHPGSEDHPGARFYSFESDNYYLSSAPIVLEEVLDSWAPELDRSLGVLVAMPSRHILLLREITEGEDLLEALGRMAPVAAHIADDSPHPVSPLLHMFHEGEMTTLSTFDKQARELKIIPTPYLLQLITRGQTD
ncbi:hypothetical protein C5L39_08420 [Corynebacterium alimapuense]|uniref:Uncharacterized protein n=1 Tax=Corynebacterium alimapuense TaxID=1576874 RepID=A0A3M8K634_9CORY|nr:hypothetical protein C5L39_08420 [Corynebacterium alimapuense]